MKKKRRLTFIIVIAIAVIASGIYHRLSGHPSDRKRIAIWLGFVTADNPLHEAAASGRADDAQQLIAQGLDVNARDSWYGWTLLLTAACRGDKDLAELLIAKSADVNTGLGWWWMHGSWCSKRPATAAEALGMTPLHCAVACGHRDMAALLLAKGADANAKDRQDMSPLDLAVTTEVVELLIAAGADATVHSTAVTGDLTKLKAIVKAGADVDAQNKFGLAPLHLAAFTGRRDAAEFLIASGASINSAGGKLHLRPLHMAANNDHKQIAELLLTNGAVAPPALPDKLLLQGGTGSASAGVWFLVSVRAEGAPEKSYGMVGPIPVALAQQLLRKPAGAK